MATRVLWWGRAQRRAGALALALLLAPLAAPLAGAQQPDPWPGAGLLAGGWVTRAGAAAGVRSAGSTRLDLHASSFAELEAALARAASLQSPEAVDEYARPAVRVRLGAGVFEVPAGRTLRVGTPGPLSLEGRGPGLTTIRCGGNGSSSSSGAGPALAFTAAGSFALEGMSFESCRSSAVVFDLRQPAQVGEGRGGTWGVGAGCGRD
jgi:hypothetical protein